MRRREMYSNGDIDDAIYRLSNEVFDGTRYIDSGINPDDLSDYTVLVDFQYNSWSVDDTILYAMLEASGYPGWAVDASDPVHMVISGGHRGIGISPMNRNRMAICITGKTSIKVVNTGSGSPYSFTTSAAKNIGHNIIVGAIVVPSGAYQRFFKGTLYDLRIYNHPLSEEKIAEYIEG